MAEGLDGKVAVVTGASTGIGRAVAQELIAHGARVVIAARSRERLDEAAAALGPSCAAVVADVTRAGDVRAPRRRHARVARPHRHPRRQRRRLRRRRPVGERPRGARPPADDERQRRRPHRAGGSPASARARRRRHPGDQLGRGASGHPLGAGLLGLQARAPGLRPQHAPAADRHGRPHGRDRAGRRAQRPVGRLRPGRDRGEGRARGGHPLRGRGRRRRATCSRARAT